MFQCGVLDAVYTRMEILATVRKFVRKAETARIVVTIGWPQGRFWTLRHLCQEPIQSYKRSGQLPLSLPKSGEILVRLDLVITLTAARHIYEFTKHSAFHNS
jgi:hypothetical protein